MSAILPSVVAQQQYVSELRRKKFKFGLTVGEAFVRGIRDIGYKSTGTALDELIDNAKQAGGSNVHVLFGYEGSRSDKKPSEIIVIDDGHGMEPDMIRVAMTWGGTHREGDRSGFGRYGYGLPSACVSTGRRYTVYSRQAGAGWHSVTIDIDAISDGEYTTPDGDIVVPEPVKAKLPRAVEEHIKRHFPQGTLANGTVVIIEKLDKVTWKTAGALQENLLRHFGVVYHRIRADLDIWVNDKRVEPIDPLFTTPGYRWYNLDEDRAQALDPIVIDVRNPETREVEGQITVRLSYMPPTFGSVDKTQDAAGKNQNDRFAVMKDYNGFIFARMGRIIDVITKNDVTTFQNNDRYIKIEIDFPALLDEEFNVTTSKQQVVPSDRMWDILRQNGLVKALEQLRKRRDEEKAVYRDSRDKSKTEQRPSEEAMERAAEVAPKPAPEIVVRKQQLGEKGLAQEAERRARVSGKPVEQVRQELEFELRGKMYKVATESMPGAPFFRVDMFGGTKMLFLNTAHRFYRDVHSGLKSTPEVRSALEILLFAIGDRILDTTENLRDIYYHEVPEWSKKLDYALAQLAQGIGHPDREEPEPLDMGLKAAE
ncbi:MAG: ATP-binding protein [Acidisphaera sp.]|nr:ATP-binding protein [Acidisphaera sp.]